MFKHVSACQREIAFEVQHGNDSCGHHFCITHLALAIFVVMQGLEHVRTHYYNLGIDEILRLAVGTPQL